MGAVPPLTLIGLDVWLQDITITKRSRRGSGCMAVHHLYHTHLKVLIHAAATCSLEFRNFGSCTMIGMYVYICGYAHCPNFNFDIMINAVHNILVDCLWLYYTCQCNFNDYGRAFILTLLPESKWVVSNKQSASPFTLDRCISQYLLSSLMQGMHGLCEAS